MRIEAKLRDSGKSYMFREIDKIEYSEKACLLYKGEKLVQVLNLEIYEYVGEER